MPNTIKKNNDLYQTQDPYSFQTKQLNLAASVYAYDEWVKKISLSRSIWDELLRLFFANCRIPRRRFHSRVDWDALEREEVEAIKEHYEKLQQLQEELTKSYEQKVEQIHNTLNHVAQQISVIHETHDKELLDKINSLRFDEIQQKHPQLDEKVSTQLEYALSCEAGCDTNRLCNKMKDTLECDYQEQFIKTETIRAKSHAEHAETAPEHLVNVEPRDVKSTLVHLILNREIQLHGQLKELSQTDDHTVAQGMWNVLRHEVKGTFQKHVDDVLEQSHQLEEAINETAVLAEENQTSLPRMMATVLTYDHDLNKNKKEEKEEETSTLNKPPEPNPYT